MAGYHVFGGHHDRAISAYQKALELNPNDADVLNDFGQCLSFAGRAMEGVELVHKAMRLNPHYPDCSVKQLGPIYFDARRYEDAISTLEKLHSRDTIGVQLYLAASHAALGHTDQARANMASVIRLDPLATLERLAPTFLAPYKMHLIGTICGRTSSRRGCRNDAPRPLDLALTCRKCRAQHTSTFDANSQSHSFRDRLAKACRAFIKNRFITRASGFLGFATLLLPPKVMRMGS